GRTRSSNWLVHRPGVRPRYVVMAHRDSKSQPLPTLGRITAGALAAGGWALMLVLSGLTALDAGWGATGVAMAAAGAGLAGGALLMLCGVGNLSPGALDNASGLAALLALARAERGRGDVASSSRTARSSAWRARRHWRRICRPLTASSTWMAWTTRARSASRSRTAGCGGAARHRGWPRRCSVRRASSA